MHWTAEDLLEIDTTKLNDNVISALTRHLAADNALQLLCTY
jgi:hypothetical protein